MVDAIAKNSAFELRDPGGTLSNEDMNLNEDGTEKSPFWFFLYFFVQVIRVLFSSP